MITPLKSSWRTKTPVQPGKYTAQPKELKIRDPENVPQFRSSKRTKIARRINYAPESATSDSMKALTFV